MRTLAIDLGQRRIGLALSDESGRLASPLQVLHVTDPAQVVEPVLRIIQSEGVQRIVVGLPLNMDGTVGLAAQAAQLFGNNLSHRAGVPVAFEDERLTSFEAEQILNQRKRSGEKLTRQGKKQRLDALSAAVFLQAYLDKQNVKSTDRE